MNTSEKLGLGVIAVLGLCCGGPLLLSLLLSGVAVSALGAIWTGYQVLLLVGGVLLVGAVLMHSTTRRRTERPLGTTGSAPMQRDPRSASPPEDVVTP